MKTIYVIYSLGNPGEKYKYTRHNAGRLICDNFNFDQFNSGLTNVENLDVQMEYIVPDTFMNETGKFIMDDIKFKNSESKNIIIVYDDIDIPFGELKLSFDRSSGGHNGVESVIDCLGTKEFYRIRVGIGAKLNKDMLLQDYVLSKLNDDEIKIIISDNLKNKLEQIILDIIKLNL